MLNAHDLAFQWQATRKLRVALASKDGSSSAARLAHRKQR